MTVCIAALADVGRTIVMACDRMLASPETSADNVADKLYPLSERYHWYAMIAGNDVAHVNPVMEMITKSLLTLNDETNTYENVERLVKRQYQRRRRQFARDLILQPRAISFREFKA